MAHGFHEVDANGRRGISHGGDIMFFHSDLLLIPEENVGFFVSFNSDTSDGVNYKITTLFLNHFFPGPYTPPVEPPPDFADRAGRYTGWYRVNRNPQETIEKLILLILGDVRITATNDGYLSMPIDGEQTRFVEVAPNLFQSVGKNLETIAFQENDNGEIDQVHTHPVYAFYRIRWYDTQYFHFILLALSISVFLIQPVQAFRHRKIKTEGSMLSRWGRRLGSAVSVINIAFLAGLATISVKAIETFIFPDSIYALLVLPVVSLLLTAGLSVITLIEWTKREGALKIRINSTLFALVSIGFLWFLDYWNYLGWHY